MARCPNCGSEKFRYELRSAGTRSTTNYYRTGFKKSILFPSGIKVRSSNVQQKTVGYCPNCGYKEDQTTNENGGSYIPIILLVIIVIGLIWAFKAGAISNCLNGTSNATNSAKSVWAEKVTPLSDFDYYIDEDKIILEDYKGRGKTIWISDSYKIGGKTYPVIALDGTFTLKSITSVIVPEGVTTIVDHTFNSCGVKYLYLPSTLVDFKGWSYFHDGDKLFYGGTERQFDEIYTRGRHSLDFEEIIYNADPNNLP